MSAANAWTISAVREALEAKKISARELTAEFYSRIEKKNPELNAFLALSPERAYAQADKIDAAIAAGDALPALAGVPVAIKDDADVAGEVTAWGTDAYGPPKIVDSDVAARLRAAGAIVIGKTHVPEMTLWPWTASTGRTPPPTNARSRACPWRSRTMRTLPAR